MQAHFNAADSNGDGKIDANEGLAALGWFFDLIPEEILDAVDADNDEAVTLEELENFAMQHVDEFKDHFQFRNSSNSTNSTHSTHIGASRDIFSDVYDEGKSNYF